MIVIFIDKIEDFVNILEKKKLMDEVYYEFKEVQNNSSELSSQKSLEITLHFLSKIEEFLVLYETKISLTHPNTFDITQEYVITELQKIFQKFDNALTLIKGKIREIFLSYSY